MGSSPKPPPPPDLAKANREGVKAWVDSLPEIYKASIEWGPLVAKADAEGKVAAADIIAHGMLELQKEHGIAFIQQRLVELDASDPDWRPIREALGDKVFDRITREDVDIVADRAGIDPTGEAVRSETSRNALNLASGGPSALRQEGADVLLESTISAVRQAPDIPARTGIDVSGLSATLGGCPA